MKQYATNGREAVNIIQLAAGLALTEKRDSLAASDVEWVASSSQLQPRPDRKVPDRPQVGLVNGLAVYGPNMGALLEIEVTAVLRLLREKGRTTLPASSRKRRSGAIPARCAGRAWPKVRSKTC